MADFRVELDTVETDNNYHTLTGIYLVIMNDGDDLITILDEQSGEYFVVNIRENRRDVKFL